MASPPELDESLNRTRADRSFFGHPRGLATLFFTEMWERFSYYGMRALLILFMTASVDKGGLGFPVVKAGAVYGFYTAMVYLLSLPGGWVADRLIGQGVVLQGFRIRRGQLRQHRPFGNLMCTGMPGTKHGAGDVFHRGIHQAGDVAGIFRVDLELDSISLADFPAEVVRTFMDTLAAQLSPHPDERLSAFRHLLQEYGFGKMIPVYDVISGRTHLSLEGAQEFFQNGDGAFCLSQQPRHNELMPCEDVCLGMQFDTMLAYNELLRTRPWTAQLSAIAEDHGLPARLAVRRPVS